MTMNWMALAFLRLSAIPAAAAAFQPPTVARRAVQAASWSAAARRPFSGGSGGGGGSSSLPSSILADADGSGIVSEADVAAPRPAILPARRPLPSFYRSGDASESFSLLSWNILLPNSRDNW